MPSRTQSMDVSWYGPDNLPARYDWDRMASLVANAAWLIEATMGSVCQGRCCRAGADIPATIDAGWPRAWGENPACPSVQYVRSALAVL